VTARHPAWCADRECGHEQWGSPKVAAFLHITVKTWGRYWHPPAKFVHNPPPGPNGWMSPRAPWWWECVIRKWHAARPGRGGRDAGKQVKV
jgi:hypothetical protein